MALKDLWNRITGRDAAPVAPPPMVEPVPPPPLPTEVEVWSNPIPATDAVVQADDVLRPGQTSVSVLAEPRRDEAAELPTPIPVVPSPAPYTLTGAGLATPGATAFAPLAPQAMPAPPVMPALPPVPASSPVSFAPPPPRPDAPAAFVPSPAVRAGDPVPVPPPVREPPAPIPIPPDEDEPEVEEPPPADLPDIPPEDEPGTPAPIQEPPANANAGVGFFGRLRAGLQRSTQRLSENLSGLFTKRPLDEAALEELEETLIAADLGVAASRRIVEKFRRTRFGKEVSDEEVKSALAEEIAAILTPVAQPLVPAPGTKPFVVLMVGVNGTGKTTTIAKLAEQWRGERRSVMLAAGDTFRAAAVEQLQVWGDRTGSPVVVPARTGADAAGLAHEALDRAVAERTDILLVDTAGRLHNKSGLMEELRKIIRVLRKKDPAVPHATILVLDATTGQNALQQVKVFREMVEVTGLVVTKLDGSAKGGVVVALAQEFGLPVHAVGVGEKAADLRPFDPREFARSLVGLEA